MIDLRFTIVESAFDIDEPERASPATVEYGLFECPVFAFVNGINLLAHTNQAVSETMSLPLVGFGPRALQRLRLLQPGASDQITIDDAGWMYFSEHNGLVKISTSQFPEGQSVPLSEALAAFERFVDKIKAEIVARTPAMVLHPQWGYWFPD